MTATEARLLSLYDMGMIMARATQRTFVILRLKGLAELTARHGEIGIWKPTPAGMRAATGITHLRSKAK